MTISLHTVYPSPRSSGVNEFAKDIHSEENPKILRPYFSHIISYEGIKRFGVHFHSTKNSHSPIRVISFIGMRDDPCVSAFRVL